MHHLAIFLSTQHLFFSLSYTLCLVAFSLGSSGGKTVLGVLLFIGKN